MIFKTALLELAVVFALATIPAHASTERWDGEPKATLAPVSGEASVPSEVEEPAHTPTLPSPQALPFHLKVLEEAEQDIEEKIKIAEQREAHENEINLVRARIAKVYAREGKAPVKHFATRLIDILSQLEVLQSEQGGAYRAAPATAKESLYREAIQILELVPTTGRFSIRDLINFSAFSVSLGGAYSMYSWGEKQLTGNAGIYAQAFGGLSVLALGYYTTFSLFNTFEKFLKDRNEVKMWAPFWAEIAKYYQAEFPLKSKDSSKWLYEKVISSRHPKMKVRIAEAISSVETTAECKALLTDEAALKEAAEFEAEDAIASTPRAYSRY